MSSKADEQSIDEATASEASDESLRSGLVELPDPQVVAAQLAEALATTPAVDPGPAVSAKLFGVRNAKDHRIQSFALFAQRAKMRARSVEAWLAAYENWRKTPV